MLDLVVEVVHGIGEVNVAASPSARREERPVCGRVHVLDHDVAGRADEPHGPGPGDVGRGGEPRRPLASESSASSTKQSTPWSQRALAEVTLERTGEEVFDPGGAVDARVQEDAPGDGVRHVVPAPGDAVPHVVLQQGLDAQQLAYGTHRNELAHAAVERGVKRVFMGLHEEGAGLAGSGEMTSLASAALAHARLLAEYGLARPQGRLRPRAVHAVGKREVDRVHIRAGEKGGVRGPGSAAEGLVGKGRRRTARRLLRKRAGSPRGAAADCHELGMRLVREASCEAVGYAPRADDAPADVLLGHARPFSAV